MKEEMDLVSQIIDQVPDTNNIHFLEFRKILLQMDRENSRKKSIRGLLRLSENLEPELKPYVHSGLAMAYFLDNDYSHSLFYLKEIVSKSPLSPLALYAATVMVMIYRTLGMKRERFEAEGSRFLIMKKIAMQSNDPHHRIMALNELKTELEARDLHEEAYKCDLELRYWHSIVKKMKPTISKQFARPTN